MGNALRSFVFEVVRLHHIEIHHQRADNGGLLTATAYTQRAEEERVGEFPSEVSPTEFHYIPTNELRTCASVLSVGVRGIPSANIGRLMMNVANQCRFCNSLTTYGLE